MNGAELGVSLENCGPGALTERWRKLVLPHATTPCPLCRRISKNHTAGAAPWSLLPLDYGMPPRDPSVEDSVPRMVLSVSDGTYRQMCTLKPLVGGPLRGIVGLQSLSLLLFPG